MYLHWDVGLIPAAKHNDTTMDRTLAQLVQILNPILSDKNVCYTVSGIYQHLNIAGLFECLMK